jgi:hypothetical protein
LRGYVETLARTLQMQFDIGVVEYRRGQPIAALHEQKVNNAVYEGLDVLNEILSKRGIKEVPPEEAKGDAF